VILRDNNWLFGDVPSLYNLKELSYSNNTSQFTTRLVLHMHSFYFTSLSGINTIPFETMLELSKIRSTIMLLVWNRKNIYVEALTRCEFDSS
jgi:hypothetical protein